MREHLYKIIAILISSFFVLTSVFAEEEKGKNDFETNGAYYEKLCAKQVLTSEEKTTCDAYQAYILSQSSTLQEQLKDIEDKREEIAQNIAEYTSKVNEYNTEIQSMQNEIISIQSSIDNAALEIEKKKEEIENTKKEITQQEKDIVEVKEKLKNRIESSQSSMRLNVFIDVIMGAKDPSDLLRIVNAIDEISTYDQNTIESMHSLIEELNSSKLTLESNINELEEAQASLTDKKDTILQKQYSIIAFKKEAEVIQQEYQKQEADLESKGNKIATDIQGTKDLLSTDTKRLEMETIVPSGGFTSPVASASVTAGTWYYANGGAHLGEDFAANEGTDVYAVGNGVIVGSFDGCKVSDGNECGQSTGGGNMIYLVTTINDKLYGIRYLHLANGSLLPAGTVVEAGKTIGKISQTGRASYPHLHIEIIYLGDQSVESYASNWNGNLTFGAGFSSNGSLGRICEEGYDAPCRIRPETVFN